MAQPGVEEDEAVEVRVVGVEVLCGVEGMEVFDVGADFELVLDELENGAEGIGGRAFREREFGVPVEHGLGAD